VSELAELYVLLVVLYLIECLAWVPRRTVGFFRLAGRWRARTAFRPNAGWSHGVVLGKPWPPLSPPWLAEPLPFAIDPQGITLPAARRPRLDWDDLAPISAQGYRVTSGEQLLSLHASRQGAASLAQALEQARTSSPKRREAELRRFLDARFDASAPEANRRRYGKSVRLLRVVSNLLWVGIFGGLGAAVLAHNLLFLLVAAACCLLLWPLNSVVFFMTVRRLDWLPRAYRPERGKRLVAMLSPLSGVRAADILAREAWADLDPLAAAAALLSASDLPGFARPRLAAVQPRAHDDLAWWRNEIRQRMERSLATRQLDGAVVLAPPARESQQAETYCPACLAQYAAGHKAGDPCPNEGCPDIPLRAFDDAGNRKAESPAGP
jgi:hypothetical protein